jgi:ABC-2 type transport system ATP-binding protein
MTADAPAVAVRGLVKSYGAVDAVGSLDFEVPRGSRYALLGPNGSGKTTTIEILEGLRLRDGGEARVLGADPALGGDGWRERIGIVPQDVGTFAKLTVAEVVRHFAEFFPDPLAPDEVIDLVGLTPLRRRLGGRLSVGQRRRLDLAVGVVGNPDLLFLDEPTVGLDPASRRGIWDLLRFLSEMGRTIMLTTHHLEEVEALADTVGVMAGGRMVASGTPRTLGGRSQAEAEVTFRWGAALSPAELPPLPAASSVRVTGPLVCIRTLSPADTVVQLVSWARGRGGDLPELVVRRPTLEDVYLNLVRNQPDA